MMAIGDKKYVGLVEDWGKPNSPATLDENGVLDKAQWPALDDLGAADRVLGNLADPAAAIYNLGAKPGENLLDNWYFVDPINQRGQTEYTATGYTIDRWTKVGESVVTLTADGLKLSSAAQYQWFNTILGHDLTGQQVTLSILYSDGVLQSGSTVVSSEAKSLFYRNNWFLRVYVNSEKTEVQFFNGGSGEIVMTAIKLELGSHQTLARQDADGNWVLLDPPPDKGLELLKCITSTADPGDTYANKVIATRSDLAGYLPLTGGMINGGIRLAGDGVQHGYVQGAENTLYLVAHNANDVSHRRMVAIRSAEAGPDPNKALIFYDITPGSNVGRYILHTGNKPSGSYTGNGDATERTIETGGIGGVIAIFGNSTLSLASRGGAITFYMAGAAGSNDWSTVPSSELKFVGGVLTIATTNGNVNYSGSYYNYQVL